MAQFYEKWEERPKHPITGVPADYFWERADGTREPRWRDPFVKGTDPAMSWYSVEEIARMAGVQIATVRQWLRTRKLVGSRFAGGASPWYIRGSDFLEFVQRTSNVAPLPEPMEAKESR